MVPLLGAIAGCHSRVLDQFWGSGRGHCWVPFAGCHLLDAMCSTPFGGVDVVPLLGAIAGCLLFSGPPISPRHPRKRQ